MIAGTADAELAPRPGDEDLVTLSTTAADLRSAGDLAGASRAYDDVLAQFPDDRVTCLLRAELTS